MGNGYRPPQWGQTEKLYLKNGLAGYFFDAIIRAQHRRSARATEHPVQNGSAISDHIYMLPSALVLDIGMSDAMDSIVPEQFTDNASKSVSAYQVLKNIMESRSAFSITTRIDTYDSMIIESIEATDTKETFYGGRFVVNLKEIFIANVLILKVSARPHATIQTNKGPVQGLTPTPQQGSALSSLMP